MVAKVETVDVKELLLQAAYAVLVIQSEITALISVVGTLYLARI